VADEKKDPKDWTTADKAKASAEFVAGVGKLIGDCGLKDAPDGKPIVLNALIGCAAYFAHLEGTSRHDFVDASKRTYDAVEEMRNHPVGSG